MSKSLPPQPSLDHLRNQAKQLQKSFKSGGQDACERIQRHLPRLGKMSLDVIRTTRVSLQEVQHVIACEYGFRNWANLLASLENSEAKPTTSHSGPQPYCLRITANEPGSEIEFAGTILAQHPEQSYHALAHRTPFEMQMETVLIGGAVCATSEAGNLQVELIGPVHGKSQTLLKGQGRHFLFGEQVDVRNAPRFIWAFD